jgi:hypothetical protein
MMERTAVSLSLMTQRLEKRPQELKCATHSYATAVADAPLRDYQNSHSALNHLPVQRQPSVCDRRRDR